MSKEKLRCTPIFRVFKVKVLLAMIGIYQVRTHTSSPKSQRLTQRLSILGKRISRSASSKLQKVTLKMSAW